MHPSHASSEALCASYSSRLLAAVETPPGTKIPRSLISLLSTPAESYLKDGLCMILLGDSTLTETAQDIQLFLELNSDISQYSGFNFSEWVYRMSNTNAKHREVVYNYPNSIITFHTMNRLFFLRSVSSNFHLYFRFIGHHNMHKNNVGLASLNNSKAQKAILHGIVLYFFVSCKTINCYLKGVERTCPPNGKRILWLQSGFHDAASSLPVLTYDETVSILLWLEKNILRSNDRAFFLSRFEDAVEINREKIVDLNANIKRFVDDRL